MYAVAGFDGSWGKAFDATGWTDAATALAPFSARTKRGLPDLQPADGAIALDADTVVDTLNGPVKAAGLRAGDMVLTRDSGYRPLRWVGRRTVRATEARRDPGLRPVRIAQGSLGQGCPAADVTVGPGQRILLSGAWALAASGEAEVLARAGDLVGCGGISRAHAGEMHLVYLLLDTHEIVRAAGMWVESFQPTPEALSSLDPADCASVLAGCPELSHPGGFAAYAPARLVLTAEGARAVMHSTEYVPAAA